MCRWQLKFRWRPKVCGMTTMISRIPYFCRAHCCSTCAPRTGRSWRRCRFRWNNGQSTSGMVRQTWAYGTSGSSRHYSVGLADRLRQESGAVARLVSEYRSNSERVATHLGIAIPTTLRDALLLKDVCVHLAQSPGVPGHWLQLPAQRSLEVEAHAAGTRCDSWSRLRDQIERLFKEDTSGTPAAETLRAVSTSLRQPDSAFTVAPPRHRRGESTTNRAAAAAGQRPHAEGRPG